MSLPRIPVSDLELAIAELLQFHSLDHECAVFDGEGGLIIAAFEEEDCPTWRYLDHGAPLTWEPRP